MYKEESIPPYLKILGNFQAEDQIRLRLGGRVGQYHLESSTEYLEPNCQFQFWSAYAPCSSQHLDAVQLTLEQIDLIRRLVNLYPQHMALVTTADGIEESHRAGKLASLIGIEGGHSIGTSLGVLRTFYQLGARYLTLTHTCNTPWADCCKVDEPGRVPHIGGLSHFGTLVVTEMNRLGMIVDLSHVSVPTMLDALATSKAPVIFSHSSAHAICNSSRNVPDHVLKRLIPRVLLPAVGNEECVGIESDSLGTRLPGFELQWHLLADLKHLVASALTILCTGGFLRLDQLITADHSAQPQLETHINHIRDVAGVDHVGIGAGYDGVNLVPQGLEDVSRYPYLLAELLESEKWTEDDIAKLAGRNLIRVFKQVEQVRDQLEAQGMLPIDQSIPPEDILGRSYCRYSGPRT
ncbi:dipeptidase 1-like [Uranotaenia lowii]|uniref:dipeptidase 1-like n=1 Tax=Uranotaenia lowii TaxID=190385 RepID=UPI00247AD520|nr:dipeptidase 1-like [Uranotaenia lowii]